MILSRCLKYLKSLEKEFQPGGILLLKGHLAMSRGIFGCPNLENDATGIKEVEARDALYILQCIGQSSTRKNPPGYMQCLQF